LKKEKEGKSGINYSILKQRVVKDTTESKQSYKQKSPSIKKGFLSINTGV
jgi:hypothetical protein